MLNTIVEMVPSSKGAHGSVLSIYSVEPLLKLQEPHYKVSKGRLKHFTAFPDVLGIKLLMLMFMRGKGRMSPFHVKP